MINESLHDLVKNIKTMGDVRKNKKLGSWELYDAEGNQIPEDVVITDSAPIRSIVPLSLAYNQITIDGIVRNNNLYVRAYRLDEGTSKCYISELVPFPHTFIMIDSNKIESYPSLKD